MPKLFGVKGGGDDFFERLWLLVQQIGATNGLTLAIGLVAIGLLMVGDRLLPGRPVAVCHRSSVIYSARRGCGIPVSKGHGGMGDGEMRTMRVLVVEDERRLAAAVRRGLQAEGFAVDLAHDGEDGLHLAREGAYDALVLDLMLPKISGYRICRSIRSRTSAS